MESTESNKKRKLISAVIALGLHALLLVVLSYLTMKAVEPSLRDDGIPVLLAETEPEEEKEEEKEEQKEPEVKTEQQIRPDIKGPDEGLGTPTKSGNQQDASGADMKTPSKAIPTKSAKPETSKTDNQHSAPKGEKSKPAE